MSENLFKEISSCISEGASPRNGELWEKHLKDVTGAAEKIGLRHKYFPRAGELRVYVPDQRVNGNDGKNSWWVWNKVRDFLGLQPQSDEWSSYAFNPYVGYCSLEKRFYSVNESSEDRRIVMSGDCCGLHFYVAYDREKDAYAYAVEGSSEYDDVDYDSMDFSYNTRSEARRAAIDYIRSNRTDEAIRVECKDGCMNTVASICAEVAGHECDVVRSGDSFIVDPGNSDIDSGRIVSLMGVMCGGKWEASLDGGNVVIRKKAVKESSNFSDKFSEFISGLLGSLVTVTPDGENGYNVSSKSDLDDGKVREIVKFVAREGKGNADVYFPDKKDRTSFYVDVEPARTDESVSHEDSMQEVDSIYFGFVVPDYAVEHFGEDSFTSRRGFRKVGDDVVYVVKFSSFYDLERGFSGGFFKDDAVATMSGVYEDLQRNADDSCPYRTSDFVDDIRVKVMAKVKR